MRTMNKRVVFSPETNHAKKVRTCNSNGTGGKRSAVMTTSSSFRNNHHHHTNNTSFSSSYSSSSSAMRFLKRVGAKVAKALGFGSSGKKWSGKVSASSVGPAGLVRSWSYAESVSMDSHRAEAIEECIEFLNSSSSSSLQRSFSTTSCSSR